MPLLSEDEDDDFPAEQSSRRPAPRRSAPAATRRSRDDEDYDDDDEDDYRPRSQKRRGTPASSNLGVLFAVIGGVAMLLLLVGVGVIFLVLRPSPPSPQPVAVNLPVQAANPEPMESIFISVLIEMLRAEKRLQARVDELEKELRLKDARR